MISFCIIPNSYVVDLTISSYDFENEWTFIIPALSFPLPELKFSVSSEGVHLKPYIPEFEKYELQIWDRNLTFLDRLHIDEDSLHSITQTFKNTYNVFFYYNVYGFLGRSNIIKQNYNLGEIKPFDVEICDKNNYFEIHLPDSLIQEPSFLYPSSECTMLDYSKKHIKDKVFFSFRLASNTKYNYVDLISGQYKIRYLCLLREALPIPLEINHYDELIVKFPDDLENLYFESFELIDSDGSNYSNRIYNLYECFDLKDKKRSIAINEYFHDVTIKIRYYDLRNPLFPKISSVLILN